MLNLELIESEARDINAVQGETSICSKGKMFVAYVRGDLHVIVARRDGIGLWSKVDLGILSSDNAHRLPSIGIDQDGIVHVIFDQWSSTTLKYFKSVTPLGLDFVAHSSLGGSVPGNITYPRFYLSNKFFLLFRDGSSGDGNEQIKEYDISTGQFFDPISGPLIEGKAQSPTSNPYLGACLPVTDGDFHIVWTNRVRNTANPYTGEVNHNVLYAHYDSVADVWRSADGLVLTLPLEGDLVEPTTSVSNVSMSVSLVYGRPVVSYHAEIDGYKEVFCSRWDGVKWRRKQVSRLRAARLRTVSDPSPYPLPGDMEIQGPTLIKGPLEEDLLILYGRSTAYPRSTGYARPQSILYAAVSSDGGETWVSRELGDYLNFGEMPRETGGEPALLIQTLGKEVGPLYLGRIGAAWSNSYPEPVFVCGELGEINMIL